MKITNKIKLITMTAALAACLCACGGDEVSDNVAPVISGIETVRFDRSSGAFDAYAGVKASDKDGAGNEFDLTSSVKVVAPSGVALTDGKAEFGKVGDYTFTYYVKDGAGNVTVVNRKVEVRSAAGSDSVAPVITGASTVRIDRETETFDIYNGITVTDKDDAGNEFDLTSAVKVVAPSEVAMTDGKVKFDKAGDYTFIYYVSDEDGNLATVSRKVEVRNIYNCYWVNATLPVLYCALDMVNNDYRSMLVFTRSDTLNVTELADDRFFYKVNGAGDADFLETKRKMARIASEDEYSYFRLFIGDTLGHLELFSFVQYNIPSSRYEVKLVSDGSWTYGSAFPFRGDNCFDLWNSKKKIYDQAMDAAMMGNITATGNGQFSITVDGLTIESSYTLAADMKDMALMAAQRSNVELWCAYPETLTSKDAKVQAEIDKANMPKMAPDAMYAALTDAQKAKFLKICNLDKATFDAEYFNKEGEYLIITGTNPFTKNFTDAEFADLIQRIVDDYDGYNILYKPHPSALQPGDDLPLTKAVFEENNIKLLPGRLPMEVITWVYSDVKIGGYDSSLFMAVPQGNTVFFIANGAESLSVLSKQLYDSGVFNNPKFYWKNA